MLDALLSRLAPLPLVCRPADENPSWGYHRIHGELAGPGYSTIGASTVWDILHRNNISPVPRNKESIWAEFLHTQAASIVSCDFFTVPTITLRHLHVLVFCHHATRQILHIAVTHNPTARFTTNAAKGLLMRLDDIGATIKFVIRDRGGHYAPDLFDHVFTSSDIRVIPTPLRSPQANVICERAIGTLRRECTDHFLILGPGHLHRILGEYIEHYNQHRPHRTLGEPPCGRPEDHPCVTHEPDRSTSHAARCSAASPTNTTPPPDPARPRAPALPHPASTRPHDPQRPTQTAKVPESSFRHPQLVDDAPRRPFRNPQDALGDRLATVAELTDDDLELVTRFIDALVTKTRLRNLQADAS